MTVITLNLLAEEQLAQEARARDPVKLFTAIGLAILTAAVAWGGTLSALLLQRRSELQGLQSKWDKMNDVGAEEGAFQKASAFAEELVAVNHSRVVMAPQLALVKDLILPSIKLSQLAFTLNAEASSTDGGGEEGGAKHGPRQKLSERLVLRIEGVASSSQPELEVDRFLESLRHDARFSVAVEDIQLRSIARPRGEPDKAGRELATSSFVVECWYKAKATK